MTNKQMKQLFNLLRDEIKEQIYNEIKDRIRDDLIKEFKEEIQQINEYITKQKQNKDDGPITY